MAEPERDLEKRRKEKAKRLKQIKAASKRMMAKQHKAHTPSGKDSEPADTASDGSFSYENSEDAGQDEGPL